MERAGDFIADQLGVPAALRTTPDERAQIQQQMMQAAQMVMQQQQQEMEGPVEQEQVAAE